MAYPDTFTPAYNYTGFAQSLGDGSFPGPALDNDLQAIRVSLLGVRAFLEGSFGSDGGLKAAALPDNTNFTPLLEQAAASVAAAETAEDGAVSAALEAVGSAQAAGGSATAAGIAAALAQAAALAAQEAAIGAGGSGVDPSLVLTKAGNLAGLADQPAARANLGLGSLAVLSEVGLANLASALVERLVPTGAFQHFMRAAAPTGWVVSGSTIGNVGSGAGRANADTWELFTLLWTDFSDTTSAVLTSAGAASTRGASATADWTAGKRLTVPDVRGHFIRSLDSSRGVDSGRVLGTAQDAAVGTHGHTATASTSVASNGAHTHRLPGGSDAGTAETGLNTTSWGSRNGNSTAAVASAGAHTHTATTTVTVANSSTAENRPVNTALLACVKL